MKTKIALRAFLVNLYQIMSRHIYTVQFLEWMLSDNVVKISKDGISYWTSQDALYRNKMHTMLDAWNYYQKEFINI